MQPLRPDQICAELERHDELLALLLSRGGAGATFAGPIVARETAASPGTGSTLESQVAPDGMQFFVLTHRSIWTKRNGVAGVQGVPPLAAHEVIAATDGTGVFCRTNYSDPALRVGVNDIFIDPANAAANDENTGLTAAAPLQTGRELYRRWGWGTKPIVGCNLTTSPDGFTNIHVQSNLSTPDSLPLVLRLQSNCSLRITAPLLAANILRTATLTDAVTTMNRAAPAPGGTRLTIRDNTLANWSAFMVANRRVRFTNGPAVGGTLQVQTDNVATPGQVQCSPCQTTNEPGFSLVPTTVTPAVGNTYVVESLVVCNFGELDIGQELNPNIGGFNVFVNFVNLNLPTTGAQVWTPQSETGEDGVFLNFYQCTIDRGLDVSNTSALFIACYGTASVVGIQTKGVNGVFNGGGWNRIGAANYTITINSSTIDSVADGDVVFNQAQVVSLGAPVRNVASWNAIASAGPNTLGHGFIIGGGGTAPFYGYRADTLFKGTLWGQGSPGTGCLISSRCAGIGAPQNITGTTGDLRLANIGVGWWWNDATGVYNPVGAGIALSWANLLAAEGAAGFGGNAHDPNSTAGFVAVETTA